MGYGNPLYLQPRPSRPPAPGYYWKLTAQGWVEIVNPKSQSYISFVSSAGSYANVTGINNQAGFVNELFNAEVKSTLLSRSIYKITDLIGECTIIGFFSKVHNWSNTFFKSIVDFNLYDFFLSSLSIK